MVVIQACQHRQLGQNQSETLANFFSLTLAFLCCSPAIIHITILSWNSTILSAEQLAKEAEAGKMFSFLLYKVLL